MSIKYLFNYEIHLYYLSLAQRERAFYVSVEHHCLNEV